jgi:prepilin-type N-terminal cleavage/methylation domain-containing protein
MNKKTHGRGFTLLELLIVIAIIAILSVILVLVLNPAETLKKSRDAQRISDLNTVKTALGLFTTTATGTPYLGGPAANTICKTGGAWAAADTIRYSYPSDSPGATISDATLDGGSGSAPAAGQATNANLAKTDGTGWIPVNLSRLTGGTPISNMPIDPTNTITAVATVANTDLVYRYACDVDTTTFELDATLESDTYKPGSGDDRSAKDGGNNANLYEVGTNLSVLGAGVDF